MDQFQKMHNYGRITPSEKKIREVIQKSKEVYFAQDQLRPVTYWEFLWGQFRYARKYWWGFQAALLALAYKILPVIDNEFSRLRSVGVIGCLFAVFIIPELWKNKECNCTQVEAACLYSLRQVYAARITLFGLMDVGLLTVFSLSLGRMGFSLAAVLFQFLLPTAVTACICFLLLCGKRNWSEAFSLSVCLVWCAVWWLIVMNEKIYLMVAPAVWGMLFAAVLLLLTMAVRKTVYTANQIWEANYT